MSSFGTEFINQPKLAPWFKMERNGALIKQGDRQLFAHVEMATHFVFCYAHGGLGAVLSPGYLAVKLTPQDGKPNASTFNIIKRFYTYTEICDGGFLMIMGGSVAIPEWPREFVYDGHNVQIYNPSEIVPLTLVPVVLADSDNFLRVARCTIELTKMVCKKG